MNTEDLYNRLTAYDAALGENETPVRWMTCGYCGRRWNDALITSITPVPSGRCPFEADHEYPEARASRA